ncbi:MAG: hypothetical protein FWF23_05960 [Alphaproteobacteria bacterium]|nr:hypothetical protein [Alphaproteobacteria bacterium]MCL2505541.1 hypothetical protein [Alphaproteobacteria bacterium]
MKKILGALLVFSCVFTLAACAWNKDDGANTVQEYRHKTGAKIGLNVRSVIFTDRSGVSDFYSGGNFYPTIQQAVKQWAMDHLVAKGQSGSAIFIIKSVSVHSEKMPMETGVSSWIKRQQAEKFVAKVEVAIEANDADIGYAMTEASAVRAISITEGASLKERQAAYSALLDGLMSDLINNIKAGLSSHLANFMGGSAAPVSYNPYSGQTGNSDDIGSIMQRGALDSMPILPPRMYVPEDNAMPSDIQADTQGQPMYYLRAPSQVQ